MPLDPLLDPWGAARERYQQPGQIQPLNPQEEDSLLAKIAGGALGGLGYAGSVLEKTFGGRAVRGLLGGKPRELLSVLPFSDTLGITDENQRVSGKDLLGLEGDDWGSTLGGIAAEIAMDPSTYLTLGTGASLSGAGKVASKIGLLPKTATGRVAGKLSSVLAGATPEVLTAAENAAGGAAKLAPLMHEPLAGVAGLGVPFMEPSLLLGTGQGGANFLQGLSSAGSGIDRVARATPMLGHAWDMAGKGLDAAQRYGAAWFDPAVMGATTHTGQEVARDATQRIKPMVAEAERKKIAYARELQSGGANQTGSALRETGEYGMHVPGATTADVSVAGKMSADYAEELEAMRRLGIDPGQLVDSQANYLARQTTPLAKSTPGYSRPKQPLVAQDPRIENRIEHFKEVPGGTEALNRLAVDPVVSGPARTAPSDLSAQAHIRSNYLGMTSAEETRRFQLHQAQAGGPLSATDAAELAALDARYAKGTGLADIMHGLDPQYAASGAAAAAGTGEPLRYFGNHPLQDRATYFERTSRLKAAGEAAHNLLAREAVDTLTHGMPAGGKRILDVLKEAGLDYQVANAPVGGASYLAGKLGVHPTALNNYAVAPEIAGELTRYFRGFSAPESLGPLMKAFDYLTNLTKTFQTAVWPAFHVRNLISGMWQNVVKGGFEPGQGPVAGILKPMMDAKRLLAGEVIPDANKIASLAHLTPQEATAALGEQMHVLGVLGHPGGQARSVVGGGGLAASPAPTLNDLLAQIPGETAKTLGTAVAPLATKNPQSWSPLNIHGAGSNVDLFAPAVAGRNIGDLVEGTNRGALFLALQRQGHTPEEAARHVLEAHFDYSRHAMTDVEAKVMKRLVPFYTFSRQNIPFQLQQMAAHPGGLGATEAKVAHDLRQQAGFLPDYLGSGLAIPVGNEDNGTKRFLTRFDLPPEQAFEMLRGGQNAVPNTLMSLLGQVNPIIKAPLEYATGKQFFTGRDLEDLYSMTDNTALDQLLMNSPGSRALTTARTLADPRKWENPLAIPTNLLTGAKFSDVDLTKQRNIASREYIREALRGVPEVSRFETLSVRPGQQGNLSEEEMQLLRLQRTLEARAQQAVREGRVRVQ